MQSQIDCIHCYLKQSISAMKHAGIPEETQYRVIYNLLGEIKNYDPLLSPAENSTLALLKTNELTGCPDPYREAKRHSNDLALALYPGLKQMATSAPDPLYLSLKISVAGNIIDLGIQRSFDIDAGLSHSLKTGFARDHYNRFIEKLAATKDVLILGDNAGEIVFDRVLVEELQRLGKKVTYVVKEGPILNDATMEDAVYTGMDKVARVVTTGSNFLGACLSRVSPQFLEMLRHAPLVIAKGQANFETLEGEKVARDKVFFLLKAKCEEVARAAEVKFGDVAFFGR